MSSGMTNTPSPRDRDNSEQDQFLTILSREDALARFEAALFPRAIASEKRPLADALGCALAEDVVAPIDVPPFDRSNVDGFAVRSADLAAAGEASPVRVMLNDEVIACGIAPTRPVLSGTATSIATGGPVPRGADAVVMVEHTQPAGHPAKRGTYRRRGVSRRTAPPRRVLRWPSAVDRNRYRRRCRRRRTFRRQRRMCRRQGVGEDRAGRGQRASCRWCHVARRDRGITPSCPS